MYLCQGRKYLGPTVVQPAGFLALGQRSIELFHFQKDLAASQETIGANRVNLQSPVKIGLGLLKLIEFEVGLSATDPDGQHVRLIAQDSRIIVDRQRIIANLSIGIAADSQRQLRICSQLQRFGQIGDCSNVFAEIELKAPKFNQILGVVSESALNPSQITTAFRDHSQRVMRLGLKD
jgi:hypothetical protein